MAKEQLPYFKFGVAEWLTGSIMDCSLSAQGLFVNMCAMYWKNRGNLSFQKVMKKFPRKLKYFNELLSDGIVKLNEDQIEIIFLAEQLEERGAVSQTNSNNAKIGWNQRKSDATALRDECETDAKTCNKEEELEEEKNKKKNKKEKPLRAYEIPFPVDSPEYRMWIEWEQHRKEKGSKITPTAAKKQFKFLGGRAGPEICAILDRSITQGYTGLFELPNNQKNARAANQRTSEPVGTGREEGFGSFG